MKIVMTMLILSALALAVACGGARLSIDEYAEECGDVADELNDAHDIDVYYVEDLSEEFEDIKEAVSELKALNPPEDLENLHNLRVDAAELVLEGLEKTNFLDMSKELAEMLEDVDYMDYDDRRDRMEDFEDKWDDRIDEMGDEFDEYEDRLSDLRQEIREEQDHLHPDDLEILMEEGCR